MSGILLDTHVWVWAQRADWARISEAFVEELDEQQRRGRACVSAFSVLELSRMSLWDGYDLGSPVESFVQAATAESGLRLLDISPKILIESIRLPGTMHKDPADRILVATAREYGLTLITVDRQILRYAAEGHVEARKP